MGLLVPIDLTAPSRSAVLLAASLAPALDGEVVLLHVSEDPPPLDLLAELHEIARPLREAGLRARLRTVRGEPARAISDFAVRTDVSWVVMGTHGARGHAGTGSVARAVIERSRVPAAAVRPGDLTRRLDLRGAEVGVVGHGAEPLAFAALLERHLGARLRAARLAAGPDGVGVLPERGDARPFPLTVVAWNPRCPFSSDTCRLLGAAPTPVIVVGCRRPGAGLCETQRGGGAYGTG